MAETIKSVLFIDYDSIHRSLAASNALAAEQLAPRLAEWVAAIESGRLSDGPPAGHRRLLIRRCYADPGLLGEDRAQFLSNGFQVIDCPPAEGRERNAAAIHMALDAVDALEHPTGYDEFVFLAADSDLSPVLMRLRAHNRNSAIYANAVTAGSYRAIADALIDEASLVALLTAEEEAATEPAPAEADAATEASAPAPQVERAEIEALARKISAATSVPLLAPRSFADLFRLLVEEIANNGYHFQSTAENVTQRMSKVGRGATRRQVVFVVKGLALHGHVFSSDDTPERLAEAFREQVLYLSESAGVELSERDKEAVLPAWIVGRIPADKPAEKAAESAKPAETTEDSDAAEAKPAEEKPTGEKPAEPPPPASRHARRRQAKSAGKAATTAVTATPPKPANEAGKRAEAAPEPASAAKPASEATKPAEKPAPATPAAATATPAAQAAPSPQAASSAETGEASKPAAPARPMLLKGPATARLGPLPSKPQIMISRPGASTTTTSLRPASTSTPAPAQPQAEAKPHDAKPQTPAPAQSQAPAASSSAVLAKAAAAVAPVRPAPPPLRPKPAEADSVESSILAAIAQAVDVLVEDDAEDDEAGLIADVDENAEDIAAEAEVEIEAEADDNRPGDDEETAETSDDLGDEIQRIIASYNRDRKGDEAG